MIRAERTSLTAQFELRGALAATDIKWRRMQIGSRKSTGGGGDWKDGVEKEQKGEYNRGR